MCDHPELTEQVKHWPGNREQPPEWDTVYVCAECGRELDFSDMLETDGIVHSGDPASLRLEMRTSLLADNPKMEADEADAVCERRIK